MSEGRWNRDIFDRTTDGLAPVRDLDWQYTAKLARPVYDRWAGMSREYVWTDDAACNSMNPELFQMSQATDPGLEGIGTNELHKFNEMKAEQAKKDEGSEIEDEQRPQPVAQQVEQQQQQNRERHERSRSIPEPA